MRRIKLVLAVLAVMAAMMTTFVVPALAANNHGARQDIREDRREGFAENWADLREDRFDNGFFFVNGNRFFGNGILVDGFFFDGCGFGFGNVAELALCGGF